MGILHCTLDQRTRRIIFNKAQSGNMASSFCSFKKVFFFFTYCFEAMATVNSATRQHESTRAFAFLVWEAYFQTSMCGLLLWLFRDVKG